MRRRKAGALARLAWLLRWGLRLALIALIADFFYLMLTWPDWKALAEGPVPKSNFMLQYERARAEDRRLPPLRWRPVPLARISKPMIRAVILAEDARFYEHGGFDLIAFKEAMSYNLEEGRLALGASTISQQTVKNLFLSPARNPVRKWHELVLTWGMESNLRKRRILELYLNIAEFGTGIYGVQAAAEAYYGVSAAELTAVQAAELAATLPSPTRHNPATRTPLFTRRAQKILHRLYRFPGEAAEAIARELAPRVHDAAERPAVPPPEGDAL
ncbi:MAG TPA: monofunctional biosynthetic peptidoglycan transglycosylase [Burkholderiales bacterium]